MSEQCAHTFVYLHMNPPRLHIFPGLCDGSVRLLSDTREFMVHNSGWHGYHNFNLRSINFNWEACFHSVGEQSDFRRVVRFERAMDFCWQPHGARSARRCLTYWGRHSQRRCCHVIYHGLLDIDVVPAMFELVPLALPPPPPPPPIRPAPSLNMDDVDEFIV